MSTNNTNKQGKGGGYANCKTNIIAMMKEMLRNPVSLTSSVCELQNRGKKRKVPDDDKPGHRIYI